MNTKPKMRTCKCGCRQKFMPRNSMQVAATQECALVIARKKREKDEAQAKKVERKATREAKEKLKTRGDWVKEAQAAINKFRRTEELDKGRGCISCGRSQADVIGTDGWKPGGAWDAGHFISVGANASLRFEPRNIWLQCKSCNAGSGKYPRKAATVAKAYEANLIAQEGIELVEWLKGPHEAKHYTIDDIKRIRDEFRAKVKAMKKV